MKIAVFGLGRSGLSVYRYLLSSKNLTKTEVYLINSGKPETWSCYEEVKNTRCFSDSESLPFLGELDFIVLSPGIPRSHPALAIAHQESIPIISEIEFAFLCSDIPIVGITGTNGKTTTTTMIGEFLNSVGVKSFVCGNIGVPFSDILLCEEKYDYAIVELSSFQLESIEKFRPHISILLNVFENHMERYDNIDSYKKAKHEIFKNQNKNDVAIVYEPIVNDISQIIIKPLDKFDYKRSKLIGSHNKTNFFCTYSVAKKILDRDFDSDFQKFIDRFGGVEYRLQYIGSVEDKIFYNDAKSTNIAATVAALNSFENPLDLTLILGGKLREETVNIKDSFDFSKLKNIFVFGEAGSKIQENLNLVNVKRFSTLQDVMKNVIDNCSGGSVLFSPAFPSFDQYENYEQRGSHFSNLVQEAITESD
jgi:UDP-N-acetylmuramoylalanine--D-glutamate ligase